MISTDGEVADTIEYNFDSGDFVDRLGEGVVVLWPDATVDEEMTVLESVGAVAESAVDGSSGTTTDIGAHWGDFDFGQMVIGMIVIFISGLWMWCLQSHIADEEATELKRQTWLKELKDKYEQTYQTVWDANAADELVSKPKEADATEVVTDAPPTIEVEEEPPQTRPPAMSAGSHKEIRATSPLALAAIAKRKQTLERMQAETEMAEMKQKQEETAPAKTDEAPKPTEEEEAVPPKPKPKPSPALATASTRDKEEEEQEKAEVEHVTPGGGDDIDLDDEKDEEEEEELLPKSEDKLDKKRASAELQPTSGGGLAGLPAPPTPSENVSQERPADPEPEPESPLDPVVEQIDEAIPTPKDPEPEPEPEPVAQPEPEPEPVVQPEEPVSAPQENVPSKIEAEADPVVEQIDQALPPPPVTPLEERTQPEPEPPAVEPEPEEEKQPQAVPPSVEADEPVPAAKARKSESFDKVHMPLSPKAFEVLKAPRTSESVDLENITDPNVKRKRTQDYLSKLWGDDDGDGDEDDDDDDDDSSSEEDTTATGNDYGDFNI